MSAPDKSIGIGRTITVRTVGELERLAGIGSSDAERFAFWKPFMPLHGKAYAAGVRELERRAIASGRIAA